MVCHLLRERRHFARSRGSTPWEGLQRTMKGGHAFNEERVHPYIVHMMLQVTLSRSDQLVLNGRAVLRDLTSGDFRKMSFHLRGLWRAVVRQ